MEGAEDMEVGEDMKVGEEMEGEGGNGGMEGDEGREEGGMDLLIAETRRNREVLEKILALIEGVIAKGNEVRGRERSLAGPKQRGTAVY